MTMMTMMMKLFCHSQLPAAVSGGYTPEAEESSTCRGGRAVPV